MNMRITLGHPILIAAYSASLLLIGCGLGHWVHTLSTALWLAGLGGVLMAAHDTGFAIVCIWLTARWVRSVVKRDNRG